MFSLPAAELSTKVRYGAGLWLAEGVATFGLVLVVFALVRSGRSALAAPAVGVYTFAGIAPGSVLPFILAQLVGGGIAVVTARFLYPRPQQPTQ